MTSSRIEEIERYRLGHLMSQKTTYTGASYETTRGYAVYSVTSLTRPAGGVAVTRVLCPGCRDHIGVAVASEEETRRKRKFWLHVALGALCLLLIMIPATILVFIYAASLNLEGLAILVTSSAIVIFFRGLGNWATYSGITWAPSVPQPVRRTHALFREDYYQRIQQAMEQFRK